MDAVIHSDTSSDAGENLQAALQDLVIQGLIEESYDRDGNLRYNLQTPEVD